MSDHIKATFYEDGTAYVYNATTGRSTTFDQSTTLIAKLEILGITSISKDEVQAFRDYWNIARDAVDYPESKVEYALERTFGLKTRPDFKLPTAIGSVVNVDIGDEIIVVTLGKDGLWREGSMIYSAEGILESALEIIVIA